MSAAVVVLSPEELRALIRDAVAEALSASRPAVPGDPAGARWLRASEAAERCGVHRSTIAAWIVDGTIPSQALLACGRTHRIAAWWCAAQQRASA